MSPGRLERPAFPSGAERSNPTELRGLLQRRRQDSNLCAPYGAVAFEATAFSRSATPPALPVRPPRVELGSVVPQTTTLSIKLWALWRILSRKLNLEKKKSTLFFQNHLFRQPPARLVYQIRLRHLLFQILFQNFSHFLFRLITQQNQHFPR